MKPYLARASAAVVAVALSIVLFAFATKPATATDPRNHEATCRSLKLRAVGQYYGCLLRAADDEAQRPRCDHRFARAFARADRFSPGCEPLDDLARTQRGVRNQAQEVLSGAVSPPPCSAVVPKGNLVTCELSSPGQSTAVSSVSLSAILNQLQSTSSADCPPCASITAQTVLWLQAWGAGGGTGHPGAGGFAQTITSIQDLRDAGVVELFFYLANGGTHKGASGGQGAAATIVTQQDLTEEPATAPVDSLILLIAGGGGGGGGSDSACVFGTASPHSGGRGGIAISTLSGNGSGQGANGGGGGKGGSQGNGGAGQATTSEMGQKGVGGRGGTGGEGAGDKVSGNPAWSNTGATPLTLNNSGQGGVGGGSSSSCTAGGGAGGGGWGGGGGGSHGNISDHPGGGGGGGSLSIPSTRSDGDAWSNTTTLPSNPNNTQGFFQLVFNLGPS